VVSLVTAAAGFVLPGFVLRDEAARRRRAFRHTLSSYLDLVNVLLAGGAGIGQTA
jgi:tight adherence protein C